jgi:hypothetical protein
LATGKFFIQQCIRNEYKFPVFLWLVKNRHHSKISRMTQMQQGKTF